MNNKKQKRIKRSKWWLTMVDILDGLYPKGKSKERATALVFLAYIEMLLQGWKFNEKGEPISKKKII